MIETERRTEAKTAAIFTDLFGQTRKNTLQESSIFNHLAETRIEANKAPSAALSATDRKLPEPLERRIQWRNEKFETYPISIKAQLYIEELGTTIKVENVVAV